MDQMSREDQRRRSSSGSLDKRDRSLDQDSLRQSQSIPKSVSQSQQPNDVNEVKISGISYQARQSDIVEFIEMICEVRCLRVKMLMDRVNPNRHRGVAFVELDNKDAIEKCINKSGTEHMGRWLQIQKAFGRNHNSSSYNNNNNNSNNNSNNNNHHQQQNNYERERRDRRTDQHQQSNSHNYPSHSPYRRKYSASQSPRDRSGGRNNSYVYEKEKESRYSSRPTDSGRTVFVGNLDYSIEQKELERVFEECGAISTVRMGIKNGRPQGFAHIEYDNVKGVSRAMRKNGMEMKGRTIRVDTCNQRRNSNSNNNMFGNSQRRDERSSRDDRRDRERVDRGGYVQRRDRSRSRSYQRRYRRSRSRSNDSYRNTNQQTQLDRSGFNNQKSRSSSRNNYYASNTSRDNNRTFKRRY